MPRQAVKKRAKPPIKPAAPAKAYATVESAAAHCGISVSTMRFHIKKNPDFPIMEREAGEKGYRIDLDVMDAWREKTGLCYPPKQNSIVPNSGLPERTKDRKEKLQTDLLQLEYDQKSGKVVDREEMVRYFSTKMATLASVLERMPAVVGRKAGMEPDAIEIFRKSLDEARFALLYDDKGYFTDGSEPEIVHENL